MKIRELSIFIPLIVLGSVAFGILSLVFLGPGDTITTQFTSYEEAKQSGAFERGWLPPILPPSAKNITEKNNLDFNFGSGAFTFSPNDITYFMDSGAKIAEMNSTNSKQVKKYKKRGYMLLSFSNESSSWIIAVHPDGRGAYWVTSNQ